MNDLIAKLVFLAVSVGLVREAVRWWRRVTLAGKSREWPAVQGRIERSETFLKLSGWRAHRARTGYYMPLIRFVYSIGGREYHGDVISYGREPIYTSNPARAESKCREYPVGSEARVFYDPDSPANACLERGEGSLLLGYSVAVGIAGIGALALAGVVIY